MNFNDLHILEPMLISKQPNPETFSDLLQSGKFLGQVKKDGYFYQLVKTIKGEVYLFSRSISKKTNFYSEKIENVPHIKEWAEEYLPNDTILIGEIYFPGGKSSDTTKIMGCLADTAVKRQFGAKATLKPIHYYIHDIVKYDGVWLYSNGFIERYATLEKSIFPKIEGSEWLEAGIAETQNLEDKLERFFAIGEEGMVFKSESGLYVPGKRPTYNFKAKQQCDGIDLVVINLLEPEKVYTGKELDSWEYWITEGQKTIPVTKAYYYGWKNAMEVGAYKNGVLVSIGRVASGLTDENKKDMAEHPEKYIGKVAELQAMSWTKDGALRHPRFIAMRYDKNPKECTL